MSWRFLVQRLSGMLLVLIGITVTTFVLTRIVPADPARAAAGDAASEESVQNLRKLMGLDRPLPVQYYVYMHDLLALNFGRSIVTQRYVREDFAAFFPATVELALTVMVVYTLISIPLGVLAALNQGRATDYLIRVLAIVGLGLPAFWLGMMLQMIFFKNLGWFPATGRIDPLLFPPPRITSLYVVDSLLTRDWPVLRSVLSHLVLPTIAAVLSRLGVGIKLTRIALLEVLGQDYVRTARSKGLSDRIVIYKHALKNAAIPIVTALGLQFGTLLGGTVIVEIVFAWPGIGRYAVGSINMLDFSAIMSTTVMFAVAFLVINLLVDMVYVWLDPRVRYV